VKRRVLPALLIASLMTYPATGTLAAATPSQSMPPQAAASTAATPTAPPFNWPPSAELLSEGAGALVGLGVFTLFLAPQAGTAGGLVAMFGSRLVASATAGVGAIAGTYIYDLWNGLPINYAYSWHRAGFVFGIAGGVAVFGVLGYPGGLDTTWFGWAANRAALVGTGLFGAWVTDRWYLSR
jgi:hypothetical protein